MKISIFHRRACEEGEGLCVVIDVLRAFTTAAFAFGVGAGKFFLFQIVDFCLSI